MVNEFPGDREVLARTLRHEVGDLLQTVYATVAVLLDRLPSEAGLERRLLADLKGRAEACRHELDAAVDLICPLALGLAPADLGLVVRQLVAGVAPRFPNVRIETTLAPNIIVPLDPRRVQQAGWLLLHAACQAARQRVRVDVGREGTSGWLAWSIRDDGPGPPPEHAVWLDRPFSTTLHAQAGLGLALARRVVELHGGTVSLATPPDGGSQVVLRFPTEGAENSAGR